MKQAETRVLDLYSSKFHSQNELEYRLSKEVRLFIYFFQKQNLFSSSIIMI